MTNRIYRSILWACLIVMFTTVGATVYTLYQAFVHESVGQLEKETELVASALNQGIDPEKEVEILALGDVRVCLIDPDGTVVYDSAHPGLEQNHKDREEIVQAMNTGKGFSIRHSDTISEETYNCAILLNDGSYLRLSQSHSSMLNLFFQAIRPVILVLPFVLLLVWGLARILSNNIVDPINRIDPGKPLENIPYEQLRPLLERLDQSNQQIHQQLLELETKNHEFEALTASMDEGLLMVSPKGRLIYANPAAARIFSLHDHWQIQDHPDLDEMVQQALAGHSEQKNWKSKGRIYSLEASPVRNDDQCFGTFILALDVTERLEMQKRRQEFTANVTHELKTPLQTISSSAELLNSGLVKAEDVPRFSNYIYQEASRMTEMVNDIIHLSRLENETVTMDQKTDLNAVCARCVEKLRQSAEVHNVTLHFEGESAWVDGSEVDLKSIVKNLIENAINYNHPGGEVWVIVHPTKDQVVLKVRDTGMGIPSEYRERIFERFFTADPSRSQSGTGLGLAIVRHAVDNLRGTIDVTSTTGKGSTFTIRLPKATLNMDANTNQTNTDS